MIDYEPGRNHHGHDGLPGGLPGKLQHTLVALFAPFATGNEGEREQWHEDLQTQHVHVFTLHTRGFPVAS